MKHLKKFESTETNEILFNNFHVESPGENIDMFIDSPNIINSCVYENNNYKIFFNEFDPNTIDVMFTDESNQLYELEELVNDVGFVYTKDDYGSEELFDSYIKNFKDIVAKSKIIFKEKEDSIYFKKYLKEKKRKEFNL